MTNAIEKINKILVFDSGVGGFSIVREIIKAKFTVNISYLADTFYFPYGSKNDLDLLERIPLIVNEGAEKTGAHAIIIACNTASTIALWRIREIVKVPVIGVVPAIKPASLMSKTKTIGLLATPRTIGSAYTDSLVDNYANGVEVIRFGPPNLAKCAEDFILGRGLNEAYIQEAIDGLFLHKNGYNIDHIVLACTHYPLVKSALEKLTPKKVSWIDSGEAIARRIRSVLNIESGGNPIINRAYSTGGNDVDFFKAAQNFGFKMGGAL